jgi:hypothetical protein
MFQLRPISEMHRCTKKLSPTFTISTRVTLEHLMISRLHLYGSISRPTPAPPIEPGQAAPSGDASRRTPQSPFGGQACALTKTVHPAQLAGQVTGGTGSRLPPTLRSAPSGDTLRVRCATRGVLPLRGRCREAKPLGRASKCRFT